MASVTTPPSGSRRVQFTAGDGRRRSVTLGKVPKRAAADMAGLISRLNAAALAGAAPSDADARRVADLPDAMHARLAAVGLVAGRDPAPTVGDLLDRFLADRRGDVARGNLKPGTFAHLEDAADHLRAHFGNGRRVESVTAADADGFRAAFAAGGRKGKRAEATVRRTVGRARQVWAWGRRRGLLPGDADPWGHLAAAVRSNPKRKVYVPEEDARRILAACPSAQWRAVVALARWGGLRVVSELVPLTWADVHLPDAAADDERDRAGWLNVRSPKTEHHPGGERRTVPLFPELVGPLADLYELAPEGEPRLFPDLTPKANLGTTFAKIVTRAGLDALPKPFTNLRASRATDLRHRHPGHLVTRWLGHSEAVEREFYLTERPGDFLAAVAPTTNALAGGQYKAGGVEYPADAGAESGAVRVQNPVRHAPARTGAVRHATPKEPTAEARNAAGGRRVPVPAGPQESPTRGRSGERSPLWR